MMEFVLLFPCGTGANAPMRLIRDCRSFMVHRQSFTWRTPHGSLPSVSFLHKLAVLAGQQEQRATGARHIQS